jgi:hypothetical protein
VGNDNEETQIKDRKIKLKKREGKIKTMQEKNKRSKRKRMCTREDARRDERAEHS